MSDKEFTLAGKTLSKRDFSHIYLCNTPSRVYTTIGFGNSLTKRILFVPLQNHVREDNMKTIEMTVPTEALNGGGENSAQFDGMMQNFHKISSLKLKELLAEREKEERGESKEKIPAATSQDGKGESSKNFENVKDSDTTEINAEKMESDEEDRIEEQKDVEENIEDLEASGSLDNDDNAQIHDHNSHDYDETAYKKMKFDDLFDIN